MESPQGLNIEVQKPLVRPIIEYDPNLQKEDVPYDVNVDPNKCTELFREFGISDEAIKKFKIKIKRKPLLKKRPVGSYSSINGDAITIYIQMFFGKNSRKSSQNPFLKKELLS